MTGSATGRAAGVLGGASALTHLAVLGSLGGALVGAAMAVLAVACLPCAVHLWRRPTGRVWAAGAAVDLAMLGLHLPLLLGPGVHATHGQGALASLMSAGLALAGAQLMLAVGTLAAGLAVGALAAGVAQLPAGDPQWTVGV